MAVNLLRALAAAAAPAVHVIAGDGGHARARRLRLDDRLRVVDSPREATVLLLVGRLPTALVDAVAQVHDQLPEPRGVVIWSDAVPIVAGWGAEPRVADDEDPVPRIIALHRELTRGGRSSSELLGPRTNPVRWRGLGPHGQGGEGMMGGHPYGRPMAMTGEDVRDGLQLDRLTVPLGPFLPFIPPGLQLQVVLQGDVIVQLHPLRLPTTCQDLPPVFGQARSRAVPLAQLERARAVHLVEVTCQLLELHGLHALAMRLSSAVRRDEPRAIDRIGAMLGRLGILWGATRGIGEVSARTVGGIGPNARAAGSSDDARTRDPTYRALGFTPIVGQRGDALARWQQRLAEAAQALALARRFGDTMRPPGPELETPRGRAGVTVDWPKVLSELAVGQPFDAFVTTLVSLDLDLAHKEGACPR